MMWQHVLRKLDVAAEVAFDEPLTAWSYLRLGGKAAAVVRPKDWVSLQKIVRFASEYEVPLHLLGNGSNTLLSDRPLQAIVLHLGLLPVELTIANAQVSLRGDVMLDHLINGMYRQGLSGLESLVGIPGTVCASIVNNAGTRYGAICDRLQELWVMDRCGEWKTLKRSDLHYGYRQGPLEAKGHIVCGATFQAEEKDKIVIRNTIREYSLYRKQSQPLKDWSLGCVFKNPGTHSAGYLIEKAGLKSLYQGDICVSPVHANFFVNRGAGTADDYWRLICRVQEEVKKHFDVQLELEIRLMGEFVR